MRRATPLKCDRSLSRLIGENRLNMAPGKALKSFVVLLQQTLCLIYEPRDRGVVNTYTTFPRLSLTSVHFVTSAKAIQRECNKPLCVVSMLALSQAIVNHDYSHTGGENL